MHCCHNSGGMDDNQGFIWLTDGKDVGEKLKMIVRKKDANRDMNTPARDDTIPHHHDAAEKRLG